MKKKLLFPLLFILLLLPGCRDTEFDSEESISTSAQNFVEYEEGCYPGDDCEILPDGRHLRDGDSPEDAGYLRDPDGDFVKIPDEDEEYMAGFFTESQAETILADAYCEGYYDAYSGEEAAYYEVTEDTVEVSNYFNEYGIYTEDDIDSLYAMYYTSGYYDACNGYEPEYNLCEEPQPQENEPSVEQKEKQPEDTKPKETQQQATQSVTVYVTNTGEKYHMNGCGYLSWSQNSISLSSAKASGYTPCSRCNPPQ